MNWSARLVNKVFSASSAIIETLSSLRRLEQELQTLRLQIGTLQAALQQEYCNDNLRDAEFRVFSQFGEDGIIQFVLSRCDNVPTTFVEFGVENYSEANTRFLLMNNNWKGLILDGSVSAMQNIRQSDIYWRQDLTAVGAFIDRDNINQLISSHGFDGLIGLLSIDIDGNDYWVWEAVHVVDPVVVVAEYNSVFGNSHAVSVPYDPKFVRTNAHYSNLYWGCSLAALDHLAARKGYYFVGCNRAGNNAFFVRNGASKLRKCSIADGFVESRFRESRSRSGELTFLSGVDRLKEMKDLPLIDVRTGETIFVGDIEG